MGENALEVRGLTKRYKDFTLDNVSFSVPQGSIVGLIGENGAGKSTTIKAILGLVSRDGGSVLTWGSPEIEPRIRDEIGVVFDGSNYPETLTPRQLGRVFAQTYHAWDQEIYRELLEKFQLPAHKKLKEFSKGMKMKYAISVAFSHHSRLLVLDEATSGLDPVMRDEILDMFLDFIQEEDHSILVSSHITSDLEKVADYIVFIHQGKVVFSEAKDELMENYGIVKCSPAQLAEMDQEDMVAFRKQEYECQVLVKDRWAVEKRYPGILVAPASIDEIMLMYVKGERR